MHKGASVNKAQLIKRITIGAALSACVTAGTLRVWAQPTGATTAPAATNAAEQPIAVVNGHEINNKKFDDLLMQVSGLRVFQEVLDLVLVQQACGAAGISTDNEEFRKKVQDEFDKVLAGLGAQNVPEKDRQQVLAQLLQQRGITEVEFQMGLQRAAGLRILAKDRVEKPTEKEIQDAFTAQYGEKVQVEILTVKSMEAAADVRKAFDKGQDLHAIAQQMNIPFNAVTISSNNTDPEPISRFKELAFKELKEKQLSATYPFTSPQGAVYYMVYLDKKIPAQNVKLEAVKDKVTQEVINMKESNWMNKHLVELRSRANVRINDPILSRQFENIARQMQAMQAATKPGAVNATQPGPAETPATVPHK
jgi:hypothetical protein